MNLNTLKSQNEEIMNIIYFFKLNPKFEGSDSKKNTLAKPQLKEACSKAAKEIIIKALLDFQGAEVSFSDFLKDKNGKPYIKNLPDFHFNISHSENAVVVAISNSEVGIDCEKLRSADLRIAKRRFTEKEYAYITEDSSNTDLRFFEIWTKKEAFLKQNGKGITLPLNSFDVTNNSLDKIFYTYQKDGFFISVRTDSLNNDFTFLEIKPIKNNSAAK